MNNQGKATLNNIISSLQFLLDKEQKAAARHKHVGEKAYAKHAAWCAAGITEAIMLLENNFKADAIGLLQHIAKSLPTDDLQPHGVQPSADDLPSICEKGECNHIEHL